MRLRPLTIGSVVLVLGISIIYLFNDSSFGGLANSPARGFYKGEEIRFILIEVSDARQSVLGRMTNPSVAVVPSLKDAPAASLGEVYVFVNGSIGGGPFGYQPNVFDSVPSDKDYAPLRAVKLVSWRRATNEGSEIEEKVMPRELRSVEDIIDGILKAEIIVANTDVVVNMTIVKWPGQR